MVLLTFPGYAPFESDIIDVVALSKEHERVIRIMVAEPVYHRAKSVSTFVVIFKPKTRMDFSAWRRYFLKLPKIDIFYYRFDPKEHETRRHFRRRFIGFVPDSNKSTATDEQRQVGDVQDLPETDEASGDDDAA